MKPSKCLKNGNTGRQRKEELIGWTHDQLARSESDESTGVSLRPTILERPCVQAGVRSEPRGEKCTELSLNAKRCTYRPTGPEIRRATQWCRPEGATVERPRVSEERVANANHPIPRSRSWLCLSWETFPVRCVLGRGGRHFDARKNGNEMYRREGLIAINEVLYSDLQVTQTQSSSLSIIYIPDSPAQGRQCRK